jgi:hypothetical protein
MACLPQDLLQALAAANVSETAKGVTTMSIILHSSLWSLLECMPDIKGRHISLRAGIFHLGQAYPLSQLTLRFLDYLILRKI